MTNKGQTAYTEQD